MDQHTATLRMVELGKIISSATKTWSSKPIWIKVPTPDQNPSTIDSTAMPPALEAVFVEFMDLVKKHLIGHTAPIPAVQEALIAGIPNVRIYAGETDGFGWLTGVIRINNIKLLFY